MWLVAVHKMDMVGYGDGAVVDPCGTQYVFDNPPARRMRPTKLPMRMPAMAPPDRDAPPLLERGRVRLTGCVKSVKTSRLGPGPCPPPTPSILSENSNI